MTLATTVVAATPGPVAGRVRRAGRWLVDKQGRVAVLHGFNVVRKTPPFVRTEFGDGDAELLMGEGFTVARIAVIWEGVEPEWGRYEAYKLLDMARVCWRRLDSDLMGLHGF